MLIDTHAHLNFNAYKADLDEVIRRSLDNNIWMINVGSQYETSKRAVEIAEKYPEGVYAAVGLHPIHLAEGIFKVKLDEEEIAFQTKNEESKSIRSFPPSLSRSESSVFDYEKYKTLAESPKVVAIGEIGLDYYYRPKTKIKLAEFKERQRTVLCQQLELAKELNLPVIFHCRAAHDDLIEILENKNKKCKKYTGVNLLHQGVVHCFTGTWEQAQKYLEMGFYLGFNGIIFKMNLDEIIEKIPSNKILIETDCPYLTPPISVNQRLNQRESAGTMRNEPIFIKYIAERIAKIKGLTFEKIAKITTENARKLFRI